MLISLNDKCDLETCRGNNIPLIKEAWISCHV